MKPTTPNQPRQAEMPPIQTPPAQAQTSHAQTMQARPVQPRKKSWGLRFSLAFAAATVILALATSWLWKRNQQHRGEIRQLQAQLGAAQARASQDDANLRAFSQAVAAPDTASVTLQQQPGGPPGQAHVLYNARLGLVVYSGQIAPAPSGKCYQLWLMPAQGAPVSAGILAANQENGAVVAHLGPGVAAQAFAVTLEPSGEKPQPTGPKVLMGALSS